MSDLEVRLDPWQVDYGSELPRDADEECDQQLAQFDVERPLAEWAPIVPAHSPPLAQVAFVDGVRRIDARVIARRGTRVLHGALGSFAVGSVRVVDGEARYGDARVDRVFVLGGGERHEDLFLVRDQVCFRPLSTSLTEADAPLDVIQGEMRAAEETLARELVASLAALVVVDGPLSFNAGGSGGAVGFIKRLFKLYVPEEQIELLAALPSRSRTPIFALRGSQRFARFSWFVRLATPMRYDSSLAGIARLEVVETVGVDAARRIADWTAAWLPRFAPSRGRDPRAPQNLLPIGALESHLRRAMGDPQLVRRWIESRIGAG
ncbi:MAG: hypothetical protein U1E76_12955 [Planctomycetota bacterium]